MPVNISAIIGTTEQSCTSQAAVFGVYPTGFCYENILIMQTALCHVSMCSGINVRDIIEIYFIAPYILASQKYDSLADIIIATALWCITICDQHRNIVKPLNRPAQWVRNRIAEQFDKSGLAISQCIFYGKSLHCSDSPLRTALWCQFWHDREAAAPVLSAFLCRWRVSPTFFGTYVDAPL